MKQLGRILEKLQADTIQAIYESDEDFVLKNGTVILVLKDHQVKAVTDKLKELQAEAVKSIVELPLGSSTSKKQP